MQKEIKEMVRCEHCGNVYLIPVDLFARVVMNLDLQAKKYVRYKTGAMLYDMSERQFMDIAKDAKATVKINRMVLVDLKKIDRYLECFSAE